MGSAPSSAKQATFRPQDNTIAVRRANSCADFSMEAELKSDQLTNNKTNNDAKSEYKEMYMELKKHMSALKSAKNFRQFAIEDGKDDFEYIVSAADVDFINDTRLFVAESFIEFGLVPLWQKEWKIYEEAVAKHNKIDVTPQIEEYGLLMGKLYDILGNCTDVSPKMCQEVVKFGAHYDSLRYLKTSYKEQEDIMSAIRHLTVLHNVAQVCDVRSGLREKDAVEKLEAIVKSCSDSMMMVKCLAIVVLAYLVDENESDRINSDDTMIKLILYIIKDAIKNDRSLGFRACEMMNGLNKLAVNDSNKKRIIYYNGLPLYADMMASNRSAEDQRIAASGLWTLSYKCEKDILNNENCMEGLRRLATCSDASVAKEAKGALWILEGKHKQETIIEIKKVTPSQHIMLSYPWFYQSTAKDVCQKLRKIGFKVWMDVDDMSGNTLEAMAQAVENAAVVVTFICQKYKESNNCRAEAEYAFQLQKEIVPLMLEYHYKPDGWLGILLGKKMYIDFCRPEKAEDSWQRFLREIGEKGRIIEGPVQAMHQQHVQTQPPSARDSVDGPLQKKTNYISHMFDPPPNHAHVALSSSSAIAWKNDDVQKWLKNIGMEKFAKRFSDFDGSLIIELKDLQKTSPEFYNASLSQQFNFTLKDLLLFTKELKKL